MLKVTKDVSSSKLILKKTVFFKTLTSPQTCTESNNDLDNRTRAREKSQALSEHLVCLGYGRPAVVGQGGGVAPGGFAERVGLELRLKDEGSGWMKGWVGEGGALRQRQGIVMCEQCGFILEFSFTPCPSTCRHLPENHSYYDLFVAALKVNYFYF